MLSQREGALAITVVVAPQGQSRFDAQRSGKRMLRSGTLISYLSHRLYRLDPVHRTYREVSLAQAVHAGSAENTLLAHSTPAGLTVASSALQPAKAITSELPAQVKIAGISARGYLVVADGVTQRLWFAEGLPVPPAPVQTALQQIAGRGAAKTIATLAAGRVLLRVETRQGAHWRTALNTASARRIATSAATFRPPRGYRPAPPVATRAPTDVPASVLKIIPWGFVLGDPKVYALYWGQTFATHPGFVGAMNNRLRTMVEDGYLSGLGQYSAGSGEFLGASVDGSNPDGSVGTINIDLIWKYIVAQRFGTPMPKYWWLVGYDPLIVLFVPASQVDHGTWGGYHFWAPIPDAAWCFGACHPVLPFAIVRVPDNLPQPAELDNTSELASHEIVEAVTDPEPFFSWLDPSKAPAVGTEIADICQQPPIAPWAWHTLFEGFQVATYWSQVDQACIPASRPSIQILDPTDGAAFPFGRQMALRARVTDPIEGTIPSSRVSWTDTPLPGGTPSALTPDASGLVPSLAPGRHRITALVRNSAGASGSASVTVTVNAGTIAVSILSPSDGDTFLVRQTISFVGAARDSGIGDLPSSDLHWDFGDGSPSESGNPEHGYSIPGDYQVRLTADTGPDQGAATPITLHIVQPAPDAPPTVSILSPVAGRNYPNGSTVPVELLATAYAADGTQLAPSDVCWTDSVDGALNTGGPGTNCGSDLFHTLSTDGDNNLRTHTVTVTVTDPATGLTASASVTVTSGVVN